MLDLNFDIQQPTTSSATLRGKKLLSGQQRSDWITTTMDLEVGTILAEMQEDKVLSIRKTMETVIPKSIRRVNIFNDDIFRCQKVHVGNCRQWSRHLVAEGRRPATVSAAPVSSKRKIKPIELLDITIQPPQLDSGDAEKEKKSDEETEKGPMKESKQTGHLQDLQNLHTTWLKPQQDERVEDFADLRALTDEMFEAVGGEQKDKSVRRRFLNWLDELVHGHYKKKIEETYRREREEGDQFYPTNFYFIYPMTRAQRERQKREVWLHRDHRRQTVKNRLDAFWEEKRSKKEALRIKEEERYEKWAAEHGVSVSSCSPDKPKNRMSIWKKRYLKAKEFVFHQNDSPK